MDTLAPILQQLGLDQTFFYIFGLVFVLYFVLSFFYLRPYQQLFRQRKHSVDGVRQEAADLTARAEEKFAIYRGDLKLVTDNARKFVRDQEEVAKQEESRILGDASAKAKASLQAAQTELETQRKQALAALSGEVNNLANDIAAKVLGRAGTR